VVGRAGEKVCYFDAIFATVDEEEKIGEYPKYRPRPFILTAWVLRVFRSTPILVKP
jgi:hypothetical protein